MLYPTETGNLQPIEIAISVGLFDWAPLQTQVARHQFETSIFAQV